MLSYLSSWFWASADDPHIIRCRDVVLDDSQAESGDEWVWVDVETKEENQDKEEELKNVLQDYIVIPPCPKTSEQSSTPPETAVALHKRSKRPEAHILKKKRRYGKVRIYPPLKVSCQPNVRKLVVCGSKRSRKTFLFTAKTGETAALHSKDNNQGFPFESIEGLQGFHTDGKEISCIVLDRESMQPKAVLSPSSDVLERRPINKPSDSWCYVPEVHSYFANNITKLSSEGWSILVDASGEALSSSMVRIWSIRNKPTNAHNTSPFIRYLCDDKIINTSCNDIVPLLERPVKGKRQKITYKTKKNRRKRNELTTKPGHTSLIVNQNDRRQTSLHENHTTPGFSFARGLNSLVHSSREMMIAVRVYLTQILDTVAMDNTPSSQHPRSRNQVVISKVVKSAQKVERKNVTKTNGGRKNLARWNAAKLQRCNKAASMRRKAMGRGGFNCAVKRSF